MLSDIGWNLRWTILEIPVKANKGWIRRTLKASVTPSHSNSSREWFRDHSMARPKKTKKKKRFTKASVVAVIIGSGIIGIGFYGALGRGSAGAYFVVFLGLVFLGVVFLIHRS